MTHPPPGGLRSKMLVNALEKEETRIAIVTEGRLEDFHIERTSRETLVGHIYKGRIENVHPSLQAAFVAIGLERNGFLHVSEVHGRNERRPSTRLARSRRPPRLIQNLVRPGDEVLAQVIRDPFGEKGPSVTMELSLPGRFLVLTPLSPQTGISKKIVDPHQRAQLRSLVRELVASKPGPEGFIVRTAGGDTDPQDLKADLAYLTRVWAAIQARAKAAPTPALLYEESDIVLRTVRDFFTKDIAEVIVDDRGVHERLTEFFCSVMPRYLDRLKLYESPTPVFHEYGLEEQIDQLHQRQVPLPSGGSVVMEPCEALTAIDVNSGRLIRESTPEDLALKTNLEAAREAMRQIRLRDIGGLIVIDFIDMKQKRHLAQVEHVLREEARRDRAQMVILPMSLFCLTQIARQKIRPSVAAVSHDACPACGGTGVVKSVESIGLEVMRALKSTMDREDVVVVEVRVGPDVHAHLERKKAEIEELERKYGKRIRYVRVRDQPDNRVEFGCYNALGEKVFDFVR
ncbi:MAG: Rne/Rng family ribonuclease [Planctomycetes bacterium]|nr:Rne/Rng family ribonuclease [Planctomycetota bacterium]